MVSSADFDELKRAGFFWWWKAVVAIHRLFQSPISRVRE